MTCKWVYLIGNTVTHCPIHFTLSDTKDAWPLSVEPDLVHGGQRARGFLYTRCGTSSFSYCGMSSGWPAWWSLVPVHQLVLRMTAGPNPTLQLLRFCVSLFSVTLFGRFSFLQVYGVVKVLTYEVSVRILFASCNSQSIVCPCKLNCGRQYCQFVFKLCEVGAIQNCSTFRVLPRTW